LSTNIWSKIVELGDYVFGITKAKYLTIAPTNIRKKKMQEIEELAEHLKMRKLMHCPWCTSNGEVFAGGRRITALKKIDPEREVVCIIEDCDENDQKMWSLIENVHIVKVSSEEMGKTAKELHEAGISIRKIAEELGISKDIVHKWTQTLRLPPQYSELKPEVERLPARKKKPVATTLRETKMPKKKAKELVDAAKELPSDMLRTYSTVAKEGGHIEPSVVKKMAKKKAEYITFTIAMPKSLYKKILDLSKAQSWDFNETIWKLLRKGLESL